MSNILPRLGSKTFFPLPVAAAKNQIIENSMDYFQILPYEYQYYNLVLQVKNISQLQLKGSFFIDKNLFWQHNINFSFLSRTENRQYNNQGHR